MEMINDWAWTVVFMDGTEYMVRGQLSKTEHYCRFSPKNRKDGREAKVTIPDCNIKMIYVANPNKMEWPEDVHFYQMLGPEDEG